MLIFSTDQAPPVMTVRPRAEVGSPQVPQPELRGAHARRAERETPAAADRVRELLELDPAVRLAGGLPAGLSGLRWRVDRGRVRAGSVAGSLRRDGYWAIELCGQRFLAHRLVWLLAHGSWPAEQIDHRDGIGRNNSLPNLREATHAANGANRREPWGELKVLGVSRSRSACKPFRAQIRINGRYYHLGNHAIQAWAGAAYQAAAQANRGETYTGINQYFSATLSSRATLTATLSVGAAP